MTSSNYPDCIDPTIGLLTECYSLLTSTTVATIFFSPLPFRLKDLGCFLLFLFNFVTMQWFSIIQRILTLLKWWVLHRDRLYISSYFMNDNISERETRRMWVRCNQEMAWSTPEFSNATKHWSALGVIKFNDRNILCRECRYAP